MPKHRLGTTAGQKEKLDQLLEEARVWSNQWQRYAFDNGNVSTLVRAVVAGRTIRINKRIPSHDPATGIYRFDVDFGMGLLAMIEEGRYNWFDPYFACQRFSFSEREFVEFEGKLFGFDDVSSGAAEEGIRRDDQEHPWAPSLVAPFLGFGAAFPGFNGGPVVGLGSISKVAGVRCVPIIFGEDKSRSLNLGRLNGVWERRFGYRFLGVRPALKQSGA